MSRHQSIYNIITLKATKHFSEELKNTYREGYTSL